MTSWLQKTLLRKAQVAGLLGPEIAAAVDQRIAAGQAHEDRGEAAAALACYQQALELDPNSAKAHLNAGNAQRALGNSGLALQSYRRAAELNPAGAGARFNLGTVLMAERQFGEAAVAYRAALALRPDWAEAWVGLGCALEESGDASGAARAYAKALELMPEHAGAANNLSELQRKQLDVAGARRTLEEFLRAAPGHPELLQRLAQLEIDAGRLQRGLELQRALLEQQPEDLNAWNVLLFNLCCLPGVSAEDNLREHRRFGAMLESRIAARPQRRPQAGDEGRKLRVGYVSGDFRTHPVANFIYPVLRSHDRGRFEVYCYHTLDNADGLTAELRALSDHWREAGALDDEALADQIQRDGIDLLIDLAGHSTGNRLPLFARKPAPLQFTWLGYLNTTGLSRMDYRLCDAYTDPVGVAEHWHCERPARLPHSQWCYDQRIVEVGAPGPLPRLRHGYWTFGSVNNYRKLNAAVYAAWAALLKAIPDSRLRLYSFENAESGERALDALAGLGIERGRLSWHLRTGPQGHFDSFADFDVALDSFPYNGATTTCDALLLGVPVLAVAGTRAIARGGVSLLSSIGLQDWIADAEDALAAVAQRQLADVEAVARLRRDLPRRLRESPLMDAAQFTRGLEAQYDAAWRRWCAGGG